MKINLKSYSSKLGSKPIFLGSIFIVLCSMFYVLSPISNAQTILPLTVSPARQEIRINPGEKTGITVKFFNLSDAPISGIIKAADFIVDNGDGKPRIIEDSTQSSPRFSGTSWINLPYDRITISPNDKVSVIANLDVPQDARPGGRYVAIYFEPSGTFGQPVTGEQKDSAITPRIASLVYIRVNGEITENALITRLFSPSFSEYGPIKVKTEILNRGDYHINPRGIITVTNMFGGIVDQSSIAQQNIFPDVTRSYDNAIGPKWMWGRYKVEFAGSYGEKAKSLSQFIYVWVFPWKVVTVIILALFVLFLFLKRLYKNIIVRESDLEAQIAREKAEIDKLKDQLRGRD